MENLPEEIHLMLTQKSALTDGMAMLYYHVSIWRHLFKGDRNFIQEAKGFSHLQ